jgi:hypothetical protein
MTDIDIKPIANFLVEYPEAWTRGDSEDFARDIDGLGCEWSAPEAVCHCMLGLFFVRAGHAGTGWLIRSVERASIDAGGPSDIPRWNDDPSRTVSDVIALCRKIAQEPTP